MKRVCKFTMFVFVINLIIVIRLYLRWLGHVALWGILKCIQNFSPETSSAETRMSVYIREDNIKMNS
jgi:hypothetical protein